MFMVANNEKIFYAEDNGVFCTVRLNLRCKIIIYLIGTSKNTTGEGNFKVSQNNQISGIM